MGQILNSDELTSALTSLPEWTTREGRLHREYRFKNFSQAMGFMVSVALEAEKMNHHPDWSNSYSRVSIDLMTHSAGGITENDIQLARKIQAIAANWIG